MLLCSATAPRPHRRKQALSRFVLVVRREYVCHKLINTGKDPSVSKVSALRFQCFLNGFQGGLIKLVVAVLAGGVILLWLWCRFCLAVVSNSWLGTGKRGEVALDMG